MPRKKSSHPEQLLTHRIRTRVTAAHYERLERMRRNSDCRSVGEVARKILSAEKITVFHKDMTLNATMEELALIRRELKAIGHNINQQTKYFHSSKNEAERAWYAGRTAKLYELVNNKTDELLRMVSQLAAKWLPRS
jgi:hypothetical protein